MINEIMMTAFLGILAWEDLRKMEVSFQLLGIAAGTGIVLLLVRPFGGWQDMFFRLLPGALLLAGAFLSRGRIGTGDGMTFMVCGLFVETEKVIGLMAGSFLAAAVAAGVLLAAGRKSRKEAFAFLPCVFVTAAIWLTIHLAELAGG